MDTERRQQNFSSGIRQATRCGRPGRVPPGTIDDPAAPDRESINTPGTLPYGAVVVKAGQIIGERLDRSAAKCDPASHGEVEAIRQTGFALIAVVVGYGAEGYDLMAEPGNQQHFDALGLEFAKVDCSVCHGA